MNSIRKKITVSLMATVLVALFAVGTASIGLNYRSTVATVEQMMRQPPSWPPNASRRS